MDRCNFAQTESKQDAGTNTGTPKSSPKGPTTEKGKQKRAEAQRAKAEKEQRRRDKNRQKRDAYRERKREKNGTSHRTTGRTEYEKTNYSNKKKSQDSKEKSRRKEKEKRKNKRPRSASPARHEWPSQSRAPEGERWEQKIEKAFGAGNFELMKNLFRVDLARAESAKRRYRELSKRYHPDRNSGEATDAGTGLYTVAFQALNEAYALLP